jgi:uncharacterized protein YbbK (DUF523 family)
MEMEDKIRIGFSACLLGQAVRFDGDHKHDRYRTDTLGEYSESINGESFPDSGIRKIANC